MFTGAVTPAIHEMRDFIRAAKWSQEHRAVLVLNTRYTQFNIHFIGYVSSTDDTDALLPVPSL